MKIKTWMIVVVVVAIVVIIAAVYIYKNYKKEEPFSPTSQIKEDNVPVEAIPSPPQYDAPQQPPPQRRRKPPSIVLFHSLGCPACKRLVPVWSTFKNNIKNSGIQLIEIEGTNRQEVEKNGIKGFPTIRFYPDGYPGPSFTEYNGNRTLESLVKFIKSGGVES